VPRVTILEVAERAGVSVGTVSNAINRPEIVADKTLARIRDAMEELGFVRNAAARQLTGATSAAIGLVVLDVDNPFFTEVYRGVEAAANEAGFLVVVCGFAGDPSRENRQLQLLEEQRVAGVLATRITPRAAPLYNQMRKRGTPVVLLDGRSARRDQCSVAVDDVAGGKLAANHLIELGHRRIGLVNGPREWGQCADRRVGFLQALEEQGRRLATADDIELDSMTIVAGEGAAKQLLASKRRPSAIFCGNDLLALGVEHALIAAGYDVPGDFAIVGYDDVAFATMAFAPLTSIRQPAYELGLQGARLLLDEAAGGRHRHKRIVFNPELVVRESTVADPEARQSSHSAHSETEVTASA
jgi:LacI family transcriptional regulator, galactose operon repressor